MEGVVGILGMQLPGPLASVAVHTREPSVADQKLAPLAAGLVRRRVQVVAFAVAVGIPWVQLLGSTAGTERGPCMLSSHHDR